MEKNDDDSDTTAVYVRSSAQPGGSLEATAVALGGERSGTEWRNGGGATERNPLTAQTPGQSLAAETGYGRAVSISGDPTGQMDFRTGLEKPKVGTSKAVKCWCESHFLLAFLLAGSLFSLFCPAASAVVFLVLVAALILGVLEGVMESRPSAEDQDAATEQQLTSSNPPPVASAFCGVTEHRHLPRECAPEAICNRDLQQCECGPGFWGNGARCHAHARPCDGSDPKYPEFEEQAPSPTSDRVCVVATRCRTGEFESVPPSPSTDRLSGPARGG